MKTLTEKMKTALVGFLRAQEDGRQIHTPKGCNGHTRNALCRHGLIKWTGDHYGYALTPAGVDAAHAADDEAWGIGGDWIPTGESLDEIVTRDLSHRK